MKPLTLVALSIPLIIFAACTKKGTTNSANNSSDQSISFLANGDSAVVTKITVDTSRDPGSPAPFVMVNGIAEIASTHDSLLFQLQVYSDASSITSVKQFMGVFDDTSRIHQWSTLNLNSQANFNDYQDGANGANDFYTIITANDGKTITGTFYGSLVTIANNNGAPPTLPITNGTFKIDLPGK